MRVPLTTAYSAHRLNGATFRILHHDKFKEYPFIYVKIYEELDLIVLLDTGCGSAYPADPAVKVSELKEFIETVPIEDNGRKPLNPTPQVQCGKLDSQGSQRRKDYMIIFTHCHFDHIGGIEPFTKCKRTWIVASGNNKDFLSRKNLRHNSLCDKYNIPTPEYTISHFAGDGEWLFKDGKPLGLQTLYTPGHTPDSLTIYDKNENTLFTGDSFYFLRATLPGAIKYEQEVIFTPEGNWVDFVDSLQKLIQFELLLPPYAGTERKPLRVSCAHTTEAASEGILFSFRMFFVRCVEGTFPLAWRGPRWGEEYLLWYDECQPEFALLTPTRLRDEFLRTPQARRIREILQVDQSRNAGVAHAIVSS